MKFIDITGQSFGKLIVLSFAYKRKNNYYWNCQCDCGKTTIVSAGHLKNKHTQSCGCLKKQNKGGGAPLIHGLSKTKAYYSYKAMLRRCYALSSKDYPRYGGRGIIVCDRWLGTLGFTNFFEDMGESPIGYTLDRIDNDGEYSPENCRWATRKDQAINRRSNNIVNYRGEKKCITVWAREMEIPRDVLYSRINKLRWSDERALLTPVSYRK